MGNPTMSTEDRRAYDREGYASHPEYRQRQIGIKAERRRQTTAWLREKKSQRGCADCEERDPVVLDFHHRDPSTKQGNFGDSLRMLGRKRLAEEMDKCDVLCANCHRRRHYTNGA